MAQGYLTDKIKSISNQLLNSTAPQLGQFMNMFSSAQGAVGMANQLSQTMQKTLGQAFGNAGELFSDSGLVDNNLSTLPGGTNLSQNVYLNKNFEPLNGQLREAIDATYDLVGNPSDILSEITKKDAQIHPYASMFYDWND